MTAYDPAYFRLFVRENANNIINFEEKLGPLKVKSVELDHTEKKISLLRIQLANLRKDVLDHNLFQEDVRFTLVMGVRGKWSKEWNLIIKEVDVEYGKSISATISAHDFRSQAAVTHTNMIWTHKTASQIVTDIASRLDWDATRVVTTTRRYPHIVGGMRSYSEIISELAWNEGFRFLMENGRVIFEPAFDLSSSNQKVYTYWVDGRFIKFHAKTKTHVNAAAGAGVRSTAQDARTGETTSTTSSNNQSVNSGRRVFSVTYRRGGGYSGEHRTVQTNPQTTNNNSSGATDAHPAANHNRANQHQVNAAWKFAEGQLNLLNEPISIGDAINLQGVAQKHSGLYEVKGVRYSISGTVMKVDVKLSRDVKKTHNHTHTPAASDTTSTPANSNTNNTRHRTLITYRRGGGADVTRR